MHLQNSTKSQSQSQSQSQMQYQKNENGEFVCIYCGVTKRRQNTMRYHQLTHENVLNHSCTVCSKSFLQKQTLELHMKSKHSDLCAKVEKFECPFESCAFSSLSRGNTIIHAYRRHCKEEIKDIMEQHEDKTITCKACDKSFPSSCGFYYHVGSCLKAITELNKEPNKKEDLEEKLRMIALIQKSSAD